MDKKHKQHLLVTLVFTLIVITTLILMYDGFVFQTYGKVVYYDYILTGKDNQLKVDNIEVYCDSEDFYVSDGRIIYNDVSLIGESSPTVRLLFYGENGQKLSYEFMLSDYNQNNLVYQTQGISKKKKDVKLKDVKSAQLELEVNSKVEKEIDLKITPVEQLEGSDEGYLIENACISNSMMKLGSLKSRSDDMIEKYPTVSLEYRYLKDKKGDKSDNDNYVVFKKITGKSIDLVNGNDYGIYNLDDDSFENKELSVVVIFSNDNDKYAFSIDLNKREVGDYYG